MNLDKDLKKLEQQSDEESEINPDDISASFSWYVDEKAGDLPILQVAVKDWTDEHLENLASLISPMSGKDFFYDVLSALKADFYKSKRYDEFLKFMLFVEQQKEEIDKEKVVRPYITPIDLSNK